LAIAAAAVVVVCMAVVVVVTDRPNGAGGTGGSAVDSPMPDVSGPSLSDAGTIRLRRYAGSVLVVHFWASWCTACKREAPDLANLYRTFGQRGVRFVGVDYEDRQSAAVDFARSYGIAFPSLLDPNGRVGNAFAVMGLPDTFIVSPDGRIEYAVTGALDPSAFTAALRSALRSRRLA
jgi:cytochrome c biogenesis protein CcmG/thiol:disulfide interchange protein DsbE